MISVNPDDISLSDSDAACTEACEDFVTKYKVFKQRIRDGELGEPAQFWIIYLDLFQHQLHNAVKKISSSFDFRNGSIFYRFISH